jgi:hypothetical protein
MSDQEDLELEALQRRLDDAFETTRPRRGFEDELWLRIQAKRPWWARFRDSVAGFAGSVRDAPAVPAGVVAVLLIAVIGIGILSNGIKHNSVASNAPRNLSLGGGTRSQGDTAYGGIPTPRLNPGATSLSTPESALFPTVPPATSDLYFGPANLSWVGTFAGPVPDAPVFRYVEPPANQLHQDIGQVASAPDLAVTLSPTESTLPRPPVWTIVASGSSIPGGSDPRSVADTFLASHNLLPMWPDEVTVQTANGVARVQYLRDFQLSSGGVAGLIDWNGERYGIEVDIAQNRLVATGPVPIGLDLSPYRLINNDAAVQLAVQAPASGAPTIGFVPNVRLDMVQLVYALAVSGQQGFYEPAYLFSGTFEYGGHTYTKRVLVPLVDPSLRSS